MQLGVEIRDPVSANHPMRRPEVQRVSFTAAPSMDTYEFRLSWPLPHAASTFTIDFLYLDSADETWKTFSVADIAVNATVA